MKSQMHLDGISEEEVDQFREDGFLFLDTFISEELVSEVITRFEHVFSGEFETGVLPDKVKWQKDVDSDDIPRSLCNVWKADRTLAKVVLAETIGSVSAQLMGWSGTRCNQDFIMWIPPGAGTICFHQDNSYQDWHVPGDVVTCWIPLSSTKEDAGTLEYVKGSHKWPLSYCQKWCLGD